MSIGIHQISEGVALGVTVADVAKLAKVSATTVSLCFQDESRISKKTRSRVLAAAQKLGYVPNQFARRLRSGKSRLIGLLVAEVYTPFMAEIIAGVERTVITKGYNVLVFSTFRDIEVEKRVVQSACELKVEGIIITACEEKNEILQQLCKSHFPLVYLDSLPAAPDCHYVINDMEAVARMGTEYLLKLGHRRILLINGDEKSRTFSSFARMETAYRSTLQNVGITPDARLIRHFGTTIKDGYAAVEQALAEEVGFSAVFAISDTVALGAIECLEAHGKKVPDDVSVLGIDNTEFSGLSRIGLTTIETYNKASGKEDMGVLAAQALLKMIQNEENIPSQPVILKPRLVERRSCTRHLS